MSIDLPINFLKGGSTVNHLKRKKCFRITAADVVTHFAGLFVIVLGDRNYLPNRFQIFPLTTKRLHGVWHWCYCVVPFFQPAPGSFRRFVSSAAELSATAFCTFSREFSTAWPASSDDRLAAD